jgi:hypothetical protein
MKIALGGVFDVASGDELSKMGDSLRDHVSGTMAKPRRIMRPLSGAVQFAGITSPANVVLSLGTPAAGRIWVCTRMTVIGNDDSSTIANLNAAVYIGDPANAGLSQCVRPGAAIPFIDIANEHAYVIHDREAFFLNLTAGASPVTGGQVVFNALVWEYEDRAIDSQFI